MTRYLLPKATSIRAQIEKLADEIRDLSGGMPSKDDALAAIDTRIEREATASRFGQAPSLAAPALPYRLIPRVPTLTRASSSPTLSVGACAPKLKPSTRAR